MRIRPSHIIGLLAGLVILAGLGFGLWFNHLLNTPVAAKAPVTLEILKGSGVKEVAEQLFQAGYLRSRWHWNLYIVASGQRASIFTGSYQLEPTMSLRDIARIVTTPVDEEQEVTVKLLEGWTAKEMATALDRSGVINQEDFLQAVTVTDSRTIVTDTLYGFLADRPAGATMEGFLFPDTYRFYKNSTPAQVLKKLLDNFNTKLTADLRRKIADQGRNIYEVVVLSSIVEAELRSERDRAMAADLFLRRIEAGMALQSDATVNYITGKGRVQATLEDIEIDSPYNTYKHRGLPPGPIGNPGISALRATITPQPNDYVYFLTGSDGRTHFAKTYEEHLQNKATYLK